LTSFVIAHRISTVRHTSQILVLEHGQILEYSGPSPALRAPAHQELLDTGGRYAELYRLGLTWHD
jgi:ABC-type multidrug transport system fused ATPase/permease subunit